MHQLFGASHMVHWCEQGLCLLQQLAELLSGANPGDLLTWCDTNRSMTDHFIYAMDSELMCFFSVCRRSAKKGAVCFTFDMEDALRLSTGPCGGGFIRRVPDVRWNPSRGGTELEDPEEWGRATKETGNGRWSQPFGQVGGICW